MPQPTLANVPFQDADWMAKLDQVVETMREMSTHTDPQEMVRAYGRRVQKFLPTERRISLSRRGLEYPYYRITRYSEWLDNVNPWKDKSKLPLLKGGLIADIIYGDQPRIIDDLVLDPADPAAEYLADIRSLMAIPLYDQGVGLNMVLLGRNVPAGFDRDRFPEWVWMSNLFGRATHTLVMAEELKRANQALDREMIKVGQIQRTLLPDPLPKIPTLDLAAYYQTSQQAGGDYYDCFPLSDGKYGILVADVSGHGTAAAVVGAMTHGIGHAYTGPNFPPSKMLGYLNERLTTNYTSRIGGFVTGFYAIYDPSKRSLTYSSAGHNPPRLKRCTDGSIASLDGAQSLPLGITDSVNYPDAVQQFVPGDQVVFYTDGITEAMNPAGDLFGVERLDGVLENCALTADGLIHSVIDAIAQFTDGRTADDDRTMIVAKVS